MNSQQLATASGCTLKVAEKWLVVLIDAMNKFGIDTPLRQAAFIATCSHESNRFVAVVENMNYSADGLLKVFPKYFNKETSILNARKQQSIANIVYANRMGNGPANSNDGFRYRARGLIGITGKNNYTACGKSLGLDLVNNPELLELPKNSALASAWFWNVNNCNKFADIPDFDGVSDIVNRGRKTLVIGDSIGYVDRIALYKSAIKVLTT